MRLSERLLRTRGRSYSAPEFFNRLGYLSRLVPLDGRFQTVSYPLARIFSAVLQYLFRQLESGNQRDGGKV